MSRHTITLGRKIDCPSGERTAKEEKIFFRDRPCRRGGAGYRTIRLSLLQHSTHIPVRALESPRSTLGPRNSRNGRVLEINVHEHGEGGKVIGVLDIGVDDYVCQYPVRIG